MMATILVTDDSPDIVELLSFDLESQGHEVLRAYHGRQALELAAARRPDVILLDIMMPELSGIEVCHRLKADPELKAIPVILLTAKSLNEEVVEGLDAGAHDYVTKPFCREILAARLRSALRTKHDHDTILRMNEQLRAETAERKRVQRELIQAQRMEAVGQLAAGIAHEINTPAQYITNDIHFIQTGFAILQKTLGTAACRSPAEAEVEYLLEEIPKAIQESLEGVGSISRIVRAIGDFSRPVGEAKVPADLNELIANTLIVSRNFWKSVAEVHSELDPQLPLVPCIANLLGQAILSLIVNSAQSIAEVVGDGSAGKGTITVGTRSDAGSVEIQVADTGTGIPEEIRSRVYDPFFTTREVGKARGLGLAIAHSIVVDKHGGTIRFETQPGQGTAFTIRLPTAESIPFSTRH
jgi:signal transduction histidine kinase